MLTGGLLSLFFIGMSLKYLTSSMQLFSKRKMPLFSKYAPSTLLSLTFGQAVSWGCLGLVGSFVFGAIGLAIAWVTVVRPLMQ